MAIHTGMRRREILSLRWANVDLRKQGITLTKTKHNERRAIPINTLLAGALRTLPLHVESPFLFCGRDGHPYDRVDYGFRWACKRAEILDFAFMIYAIPFNAVFPSNSEPPRHPFCAGKPWG